MIYSSLYYFVIAERMAPKKKVHGWVDRLHYAVQHNLLSEVKSLIRSGADVNHQFRQVTTKLMPTRRKQTALFMAVRLSKIDMLNLLLDSGANVNYVDELGENALFSAVEVKSNIRYVKRLLEAGADVNLTNNNGNNLAQRAIHMGSTQILEYLLQNGMVFDTKAEEVSGNLYLYIAHLCKGAMQRQIHTRIRSAHSNIKMMQILCAYAPPTHYSQLKKVIMWSVLFHGEYGMAFAMVRNGACVRERSCCRESIHVHTISILSHILIHIDKHHMNVSYTFLEVLFHCGASLNKLQLVLLLSDTAGLTDECIKLLHQFISLSQPMSLADCARICVRDCLDGNLLHSVKLLPIPIMLRDYIAFNGIVIDDVIRTQNALLPFV